MSAAWSSGAVFYTGLLVTTAIEAAAWMRKWQR